MPLLRKELAGAAAIGIAAWGGGGKAPMLIFREALEIFALFCIFPFSKICVFVLISASLKAASSYSG